MTDVLYSAPADRNREPILQVLQRWLPKNGTVLEIASGTGQHIEHFARALPDLRWQPSDPDPRQRASIGARINDSELDNVADPIDLDVLADWPDINVDAVIVANMLHISVPATLPAFFRGTAEVIEPGGILHIYGPFKRSGAHTTESNAEFDRSLRERNPVWGIRDLERVVEEATASDLTLREIVDMPANNFSLIFESEVDPHPGP